MKLHGAITINGRAYAKGSEVRWYTIYPFFLIHMLMFGLSGFLLAYGADTPMSGVAIHGGIAITVYTVFYLAIFGWDEVKWMLINAGLGLMGIYSQIGWLLSLFDKSIDDFPWYRHVVPFMYYVLYTFLLRQLVLDLAGAREDEQKKSRVEAVYILVSFAVYLAIYLAGRRGAH
ncbi:MAG: hypothetical protein ABI588_03500 [Arenimonas sp.]